MFPRNTVYSKYPCNLKTGCHDKLWVCADACINKEHDTHNMHDWEKNLKETDQY